MGIQAAIEATAPQRFPVVEITQRTPCDLQTAIKNLMFTVAYGTAMPTQPGDVYHGQQIPVGYKSWCGAGVPRLGDARA